MTQAEILQALQPGHAEILALIEQADEAALIEAGAVGSWSVKDVLTHLTSWEVDLLTSLGKARRGQKPASPDLSDAQVDALNAQWHREMASKPLDKVLEDFKGARRQTVRQVEGLTDADLEDSAKYAWLKGETLAAYIASETFEHEQEHLPELRRWFEGRQAK